MSMKNSNDTIGNRNRDLLDCGAEPQPIAPPRAYLIVKKYFVRNSLNISIRDGPN